MHIHRHTDTIYRPPEHEQIVFHQLVERCPQGLGGLVATHTRTDLWNTKKYASNDFWNTVLKVLGGWWVGHLQERTGLQVLDNAVHQRAS